MKKHVCLFLVVAMLLGSLPAAAQAYEDDVSVAASNYGYTFLSQDEKLVYDAIEGCVEEGDSEVEIDREWGISATQLKLVVEMFTADHPEYFWFTGAYSYSYYGSTVMGFYPNYVINGENVSKAEISQANAAFGSATEQVLAQMEREAESDDYSKAVWLHDKVAQLVSYGYGSNHQTAYGALIDGKAVCAGYARLYQHFLKSAGISAWTVRGTSVSPASNTAVRHAWTLLWLDGKCVYTDVTWDDQGEEIFHVYFARSLDEFSVDHTADQSFSDKLPVCTCDDHGYFDVYQPESKITGTISADVVSGLLAPNGDGRSWSAVLFDPSGTDVMYWIRYSGEIWGVVQELGFGSYSVSTRSMGGTELGMEIHLTLVDQSLPAGVTVSGTVTSYLSDMDAVSVYLIKDGSPVYQTEISGKTASYSFAGVPAGAYTMRVEKNDHVAQELNINVDANDVTADVELCPAGDVTGDGKVNMKDWSALYAHINEVSPLSGYALSCADVTGDGKLNMKDWNRLYGHVSETDPLW